MSETDISKLAEDYFEKHNIKALFKSMMKELAIHKPQDPISFLLALLDQPVGKPRILIIAPPTPLCDTSKLINVAMSASGAVHLDMNALVTRAVTSNSPDGQRAQEFLTRNEPLPASLLVSIVASRIAESDCVRNGWLLTGLCDSEAIARALQTAAIFPSLVVRVDIPEDTLAKRIASAIVVERERILLGSAAPPATPIYTPLAHSVRVFLNLAAQDDQAPHPNSKGPVQNASPSLSLSYSSAAGAARKALEVCSAGQGAGQVYGSLCKIVKEDDERAMKTVVEADQGV